MRIPTSNERFLLGILLAIAFVGGNWFGYKWYATKQASLVSTAVDLRNEQDTATAALQETPTWTQRKAWLNEKQPVLGDEGDAKAAVLEFVQKGARANKLEILEQSLDNVEHGPGGTRVNVAVKVKGSMQDLVNWLTALEKPDDFYAISRFSLKADPDQKSLDCTLQIARYYKGGTS